MKTLRLFIDSDLELLPSYEIISEGGKVEKSGTASFSELEAFEEKSCSVFLDANCCTIFRIDSKNFPRNKMELFLASIEDNLVDNLEDIISFVVNDPEDETIKYLAVLNRDFYQNLQLKLNALGKQIKFVQSFAFTVDLPKKGLSIFLGQKQSFVRNNYYEYFLLDDDFPVPSVLDEFLRNRPDFEHTNEPLSVNLYLSGDYEQLKLEEFAHKYNLALNLNPKELDFDTVVWDFYHRNLVTGGLKLNSRSKELLKISAKQLAIFGLCSFLLLCVSAFTKFYQSRALQGEIQNNLAVLTSDSLNQAQQNLKLLAHRKGQYSKDDAFSLLQTYLQVVPETGTQNLRAVVYNEGHLWLFLKDSAFAQDFVNYQKIFAETGLEAKATSWSTFRQQNKIMISSLEGLTNVGSVISLSYHL